MPAIYGVGRVRWGLKDKEEEEEEEEAAAAAAEQLVTIERRTVKSIEKCNKC